MKHRPVLILKTGSTLPAISATRGDFGLWFTNAMSLAADDVVIVEAETSNELPPPQAHRAVVITGSAAMVTSHAPWIERAADWLREVIAGRVAILGVCFGHQLLAHALGGEVGSNKGGREIGTVELTCTRSAEDDVLFHALPSRFACHMTHEECVWRLPPGAARLAKTKKDANAAFSMPGQRAWGVQFHPEFDADIMRGYIEGREDKLAAEGFDAEGLLNDVQAAPNARALLHRFRGLV